MKTFRISNLFLPRRASEQGIAQSKYEARREHFFGSSFIAPGWLALSLLLSAAACDETTSDMEAEGTDPEAMCAQSGVLLAVGSPWVWGTPMFEELAKPYGHSPLIVDGICTVYREQPNAIGWQSVVATGELQKELFELGNAKLLARYDGQDFSDPLCQDGAGTVYRGRWGAYTCNCVCDTESMPEDLRAWHFDVERIHFSNVLAMQPFQGELTVAVREFDTAEGTGWIPETRWEQREFPLDLPTLAALHDTPIHRVASEAVASSVRAAFAEHQAWQASLPADQFHRSSKLMYLQNDAGRRFVVGISERLPLQPDFLLE